MNDAIHRSLIETFPERVTVPWAVLVTLIRFRIIGDEVGSFVLLNSGDDYDPKKAYVFACLCELTYLPFTRFDLMARRRYKVVPNEALGVIKKYKQFITLEDVFKTLTASLDTVVAAELLTTRFFSYLAFDTPAFTIIAVRGTVWSTPDTLLNAKVRQEHNYHSGFYKEASEALPLLKASIPDKLLGHGVLAGRRTVV